MAQALVAVGRADAAMLFATPALGPHLPALLDAAVGALGTEAVVGACAHGVLAQGREIEGGVAVAVLALAGLEAHPFLLAELEGEEAGAGEEIAAHLGGAPGPADLVVLLPDPRTLHLSRLIEGVRAALAPAHVVGAGAADPLADAPAQWCGRRVETGALAGIALRAPRAPRIGVTQACRPASELLTVTRAEGNWILELDGRPALDLYREVARGPLADDLRRAAASVLVALPVAPDEELVSGGYRVRHVVGFAPERKAFAMPEPVGRGRRLALALREPEAAREDLKQVLASLGPQRPACALYFDCCARGASFFGVCGLEAAYLENAFADVPIAGMFGSCEIGPVGGRTELLTYTGVLALLDGPR